MLQSHNRSRKADAKSMVMLALHTATLGLSKVSIAGVLHSPYRAEGVRCNGTGDGLEEVQRPLSRLDGELERLSSSRGTGQHRPSAKCIPRSGFCRFTFAQEAVSMLTK